MAQPPPTGQNRRAIVLDPQVMLVGGAVALVGVVMAAFFLWMVPTAAAREAKAACTGLRTTGPALCNGQPCELPMQAPDFTALDNQGNKVSLSQFKGKVVLVNFWASWCGVCKTEKPQLFKMAEDMASDDFVVIALASDRSWSEVLLAIVDALAPSVKLPDAADVPLKDALAVYDKAMPHGLPFKVFLDPPEGQGNIGAIAAAWGITAVPESALIDRQGRIRAYFVNKRDWDSPVAQTCLRSVIDE
ncbi:MAG TPA: TlpA disulfide reductase family protein [Kofleriaceae bacterium]|jgi:thiol-disulfide isomerase/thioredoxin|nr:TlpA disulfide reductase family protein [Kofleriaceae bacterium]